LVAAGLRDRLTGPTRPGLLVAGVLLLLLLLLLLGGVAILRAL